MKYKIPQTVSVGGLGKTKRIEIGGTSPVSIQTMWKEGIIPVLSDNNVLDSILLRIDELSRVGCDLIRFAVPDMESAKSLCLIAENTSMPLVADIHFDYKLALECLKGNVAKIRINPGNIGSRANVEKVVNACKEKGAAIRIGVNSGSLPQDILAQVRENKISRAEGLALTAAREAEIFNELNFDSVVVSMKASSVEETILANESFASKFDIPLHIGVTEAGPLISGVVKSTIAFTHLLNENIGSTIRVSLSDTPMNEVITGREILRETGKRPDGVKLISCPRCGRLGFDVHSFVTRWQTELLSLNKNIIVAVMGCVVNGPGEGKHADLGICGAGDSVMIFKHGQICCTLRADNSIQNEEMRLKSLMEEADNAFRKELYSL
ncbi:MAG: (E)-4-hydroxy-3-methylbut-2-enyl-diphosphate synthase [Spirochaetaceae bacterium]|nr:(E)-4-hydroxy-3-methylbut-2-enyl-diphosphate synthase [Spirochaetaceae bacterium]